MITGISIENFKLFGKRVDIELAPITRLFGRNSSGKRSVGRCRSVLDTAA